MHSEFLFCTSQDVIKLYKTSETSVKRNLLQIINCFSYRLCLEDYIMLYWVHLAWAEFELTTLVVIGTDCTGIIRRGSIPPVYIIKTLKKTKNKTT
jgi:hypothetical protein